MRALIRPPGFLLTFSLVVKGQKKRWKSQFVTAFRRKLTSEFGLSVTSLRKAQLLGCFLEFIYSSQPSCCLLLKCEMSNVKLGRSWVQADVYCLLFIQQCITRASKTAWISPGSENPSSAACRILRETPPGSSLPCIPLPGIRGQRYEKSWSWCVIGVMHPTFDFQ